MILGIDLGGTHLRIAPVREGQIGEVIRRETHKDDGPEGIIDQILELIHPYQDLKPKGIGIGMPSIVDGQGVVYEPLNLPDWKEVPLGALLKEKTGLPVRVENDANCFALGEKFYGMGQEVSSMVGITLGTGVGLGVIVDGQLFSGVHGAVGEVCCIPYLNHDYEYYASTPFFRNEKKREAGDLFHLARQGDFEALDIFREYGEHVGALLSFVLHTYDPDLIVLGGSIAQAWPFFKEAAMNSVKSPFSQLKSNLHIETSTLSNAAILGAAHLLK